MKTILVPTDFSSAAGNAIDYAAEIAKLVKAKIILFHAYHVPAVVTDVPTTMPSQDDLEKNAMNSLKKIQADIEHKEAEIDIECVCQSGFVVDEINLYVKENEIDLIVMGMQGSGFITEKIIGSTVTSLIRQSKCPVLVIDQRVRFKAIKKIVWACDYLDINEKTIVPLKEIAALFDSHIYVLNVVDEPAFSATIPVSVRDFIRLEDSLESFDHTIQSFQNDDVVDGINQFIEENNMDMVFMIPRKHSILKNIFHEPNTKRMAFHTHIPLLTMH
jgi:nucleotide-binding universal stress UspA family protein